MKGACSRILLETGFVTGHTTCYLDEAVGSTGTTIPNARLEVFLYLNDSTEPVLGKLDTGAPYTVASHDIAEQYRITSCFPRPAIRITFAAYRDVECPVYEVPIMLKSDGGGSDIEIPNAPVVVLPQSSPSDLKSQQEGLLLVGLNGFLLTINFALSLEVDYQAPRFYFGRCLSDS